MGNATQKQVYVMLLVLIAVGSFQAWWLRDMYMDHRRTFFMMAVQALNKGYSDASFQQLHRLKMDSSLQQKVFTSPTLQAYNKQQQFLVLSYHIDPSGAISHIQGQNHSQEASERKIMELASDSTAFMEASQGKPGILRVLSKMDLLEPDSILMTKYTKEALQANDIDVPFTIRFYAAGSTMDTTKAAVHTVSYLSRSGNSWVAGFPGLTLHLLKKMLLPIFVSILLVILISAGLVLLRRGIARQKEMEQMRASLMSNITHELKTPLTVLSALNEALFAYNGVEDQDKTRRYLKLSKEELVKLERQIDQVISVARLEVDGAPTEISEFRIDLLLHSIIERFSAVKAVEYAVKIEVKDQLMTSSQSYLSTVLTNLLDNAIKYSSEDVLKVEIVVQEEPGFYVLTVEDNGTGIDARYVPYVFDKFYRVPDNNVHEVKGYGLGLSYARELITQLHGSIDVRSEKGKGTCFTIKLPKVG